MTVLVSGKTAAENSHKFTVQRNESVGISAYGLAGAEVVQIQRQNGDGTWSNTSGDGSTLTATEPMAKITASGTYRVVKPVTASLCGVDID